MYYVVNGLEPSVEDIMNAVNELETFEKLYKLTSLKTNFMHKEVSSNIISCF